MAFNFKMKIEYKKLDSTAKTPAKGSPNCNGYDLFALSETAVIDDRVSKIPTGISMAIPNGYVGLICDKSGIGISKGCKVMGGVIDSDYRGELMVGLIALTPTAPTFNKGDKIAQILFIKTEDIEWAEVAELDTTVRGTGGFGSTGK